MNHYDKYAALHGEKAGALYTFTVKQIECIKGYQLLANGELSDEEFQVVADRLAKNNSIMAGIVCKYLQLSDDEVELAMQSASAFIEKVISDTPEQ